MKNTFGESVSVTLFGESHGAGIGAVLDGMAPGVPVDLDFLSRQMDRRRSLGAISTARKESDRVELLSGVCNGRTTGTPLALLIRNENAHSSDYELFSHVARPGHADYTAYEKYHGFADVRGGGHFSGRLTAPLVAAGAIALTALQAKGIQVGTHIARAAGISDCLPTELSSELAALRAKDLATFGKDEGTAMQDAIHAAKQKGDSVGGILETFVLGLPAGIGEPWFDSLEGVLSHALFSIPAVKGVEFGDGFAVAELRGSEANDPFRMENGRIVTETNRAGGILGGISNGMPLVVRCAVKPTPSIYLPQKTVDFIEKTETDLQIHGRHDPAIVHRAVVVAESVTALVLCDLLARRYGTDWLCPNV